MLSKDDKRDYRWSMLGRSIKFHVDEDQDVRFELSSKEIALVCDSIDQFFESDEFNKEMFFDDET